MENEARLLVTTSVWRNASNLSYNSQDSTLTLKIEGENGKNGTEFINRNGELNFCLEYVINYCHDRGKCKDSKEVPVIKALIKIEVLR